MKYFQFAFLLLGFTMFVACGDDDDLSPEAQLEVDIEIIQDYLTDNNLTALATPSGLHYIIEETGTGDHPAADELAIVNFIGFYADGASFGQSNGPEIFDLSVIIDGFQEGIPLFEIGGKGKLLLPSALAFGAAGTGQVPPNSVLIFDIELPDVCTDETAIAPKQLCLDIHKIETYLADNSLDADTTSSGLRYIIEEEGTGNFPDLNDMVEVHYKGYFLNGDVFDQTTGTAATFPLNGVIPGWQEGMQLFKKGGNGILFLPSKLGYGITPPAGIPTNSVLIFDVELVDF